VEGNFLVFFFQNKNIFILVDIAYQGFATGDLDTDAFLPRYLDRNNFEFFAAQSFSKNFGLYSKFIQLMW
jgi:aspartate/tyrosine/aromatic aminotransferase